MTSNADDDLRGLWQKQNKSAKPIPLAEVRAKAERLDAHTRRWRVITALLFTVLLIGGAVEVWLQKETLERAGDVLSMAALVYVAYRFRTQRLAAPPVALGRSNCVVFYRAELVRQRDLSKDSWGYLLPFVPGVALSIFGGGLQDRPTSQLAVLIALAAALFLGVAGWNARTARRLQAEIERFDARG